MSLLVELYRNQLLVFLFVLARMGGLVVAAPVFGAREAPKSVRLALALAVSLMVAPVFWNRSVPGIESAVDIGSRLCREAALGLVFGLALICVVAGLQIAGRVVGQMTGIGLVEVIDSDTGTRSPLFGRLFVLVATAVFLLAGGHRQVVASVLDTFNWMPPGEAAFSAGLVATLHGVVAHGFLLALRVAAPVIVALVAAAWIVGFLSRAVPQLNAIMVGMNLNTIIALAVLSISLGGAGWLFHEHAESAVEAISVAVARLAAGG